MRNVESTVFFSCYATETIFYHKGTWLKVYWINVKYNIIAENFLLTGILLHPIFRLKPDSKLGHILISVNWTGLCPERVKTWWFTYLNKIQDVHLCNVLFIDIQLCYSQIFRFYFWDLQIPHKTKFSCKWILHCRILVGLPEYAKISIWLGF